MSAKTGVAPVSATEFAVAAKVNDGTMTSSPGPTPAASRPRCEPDGAGVDRDAGPAADDLVGELLLEGGDLGALRDHSAAQDAVDRLALLVADERLRCGDHRHCVPP